MEPVIAQFLVRHRELRYMKTVPVPPGWTAWPVEMVARRDGLLLGLSIDFGGFKHMSVSRRQPPDYERQIALGDIDYQALVDDFLAGHSVIQRPGYDPLVIHYYQQGHPDAKQED